MKPQGSGIRRARRAFFVVCSLAVLGVAGAVLERLHQGKSAPGPQGSAAAAPLLADIRRFRTTSATLDPQQAAREWLRLLDRAVTLGPRVDRNELAAFDPDLGKPVGVQSVISALPPPSAWPTLRDQARLRSSQPGAVDYRAWVPLLVADILLGDHEGAQRDLESIDTRLASLPPDERQRIEPTLEKIRQTMANLYGDPQQIAVAFEREVAKGATGGEPVKVPDLVTLVGEAEATRALRKALAQPRFLEIESADTTRALARRIALENPGSLQVAQWALVDSIGAAPLYEALVHRFGQSRPSTGPAKWPFSPENIAHQEANSYYLLFLIVNGRLTEARTFLESIAGSEPLSIPRPAIAALENAHQNEALYAFLGGILVEHPDIQAWDAYITRAAYIGHGREALASLDKVLDRSGLPPYLRADLQRRRIDALLALDDVPGALVAIREFLGAHPSASDDVTSMRAETGLRLAGLGRVLGRPDVALAGLRFVEETLALPQGNSDSVDRGKLLQGYFAEARKQHREADAQRVAIAELARRDPRESAKAESMETIGIPDAWPTRRKALTEMLSLDESANRHADARALLDEADGWGGRDLRDLLQEKDSLGLPLGVSAARALAALGERETAIQVVTATIGHDPGNDGAYELESSIDPQALTVFARQFKTDQFEERPLIWTASVLAHKSDYADAEKAVRAAIAIDPSDGEEGVNDRMRAYSVLADILAAVGDRKTAAENREIVAAIRISEKSDELYHLGLLQRAFAGYREALGHFSNAYCIQSRLAVQLSRQGHHEEAAEHYRRAYELMPASFGRVESHCFGCESVFDGTRQQSIAGEVFTRLVQKDPTNPRVHYLQGYLLEEEGRYAEALPAFRKAVQIDGAYLNAWRHLGLMGKHIHMDAGDRDVVTVKLLELDPRRRHVWYDIGTMGNFTTLWSTLEQAARSQATSSDKGPLYPLKASARRDDEKQAQLSEEQRSTAWRFRVLMSEDPLQHDLSSPPVVLGKHPLLLTVGQLFDDDNGGLDDGVED